jgi:hypothetical protein
MCLVVLKNEYNEMKTILDSRCMTTLLVDVCLYLYDAGFKRELYVIKDFDNRDYIEVFFMCNKAIDYIKKDILVSDYSDLLEIKKYRHSDGIYSAIITYID